MRRAFNWLSRWLRSFIERARGHYYEGPTPPPRLREAVMVFAAQFSRATTQQWIDFAARHAAESYKSGFIRGLENQERRRDPQLSAPDERHDWHWSSVEPARQQLQRQVQTDPDFLGRMDPVERQRFMLENGIRAEVEPDERS